MKNPIYLFLLKFFLIYFTFFGLYKLYLIQTQDKGKCDPYTTLVAKHASFIYNSYSTHTASIKQNKTNPYMDFYIDNTYASIVNEGCNALSIVLLMLSFILAMGKNWWKTILFSLISYLILYFLNILRVGILSHVYLYYSDYKSFMHDIFMPLILYGFLFISCFVWLHYFILEKTFDKGKIGIKTAIILLLLCSFIGIRFFQNQLFYDPLLHFFIHKDYQLFNTLNIPKHILSISLRYILNMILGGLLIYVLFQNKKNLKTYTWVLLILFLPLILIYGYFLYYPNQLDHTAIFYTKRFLLHPIFELLALLIFYYQNKINLKKINVE